MFLYDTHVHSSETSKCGKSTAREMVRAYKAAGYSGFALTNHFYHGNTAVDRTLSWRNFVQPYIDAYYEACDEGAKLDFDVIFGIEEGVGDSKEMLCYNMDVEALLSCKELRHASRAEFIDFIHSAGGIVIHAHPCRFKDYMKAYVEPYYDGYDGLEVYNGGNFDEDNQKALLFAASLGKNLILTAGNDAHSASADLHAGILLPERVKTSADFVEILKSGNYELKTK